MSTETKALIEELNEITKELKRLGNEMFKLRKRKDDIEKKIQLFLEETQKIGVKSNDISVVLEEKTKLVRKKKNEKLQDCINILNHYNIGNAQKICTEFMNALKGQEENIKKIKITNKRK
jgi:hypothetical protein